jgi:hypothetical protein
MLDHQTGGFSMTSYPARLLCAGKEPEFLHTRCAVLRHVEYEAQAATVPEVEVLLRTGAEFDLIIVSAQLSESERRSILICTGETPTYVLHGLTLAAELLAQVEGLLPAPQIALVGTTLPLIIPP